MSLGTFTPPVSAGKASPFDPRTNHSKPLIVVLREFKPEFVTPRFPTAKPVVICDVVDLLADTVHPSVIWGAAAVVDRLKGAAVGEKLPVILEEIQGASGNKYATVLPLEGKMLELAVAWDGKNSTRIDDERDAYLAAQREAQATTPPASLAKAQAAPASTIPAAVDDDALAQAIAALA